MTASEPTLQSVTDKLDRFSVDVEKLTDKVNKVTADAEKLTANMNRYEERFERLDNRLWTLSLGLVGTAWAAIFAVAGVVVVRSLSG
ncbi:MAG: hypothetical protein ACUVSQ_01230 [Pseudanabaenaceae cyanobacterium]